MSGSGQDDRAGEDPQIARVVAAYEAGHRNVVAQRLGPATVKAMDQEARKWTAGF